MDWNYLVFHAGFPEVAMSLNLSHRRLVHLCDYFLKINNCAAMYYKFGFSINGAHTSATHTESKYEKHTH